MAEEITLSIMEQRVRDVESILRPLLDEFESETHIRVHIQTLSWSTGMETLLHTALHGEGPDVSEFGTSWVSSFVAMNALYPFHASDLRIIGNSSQFLPASWQTGIVESGQKIWSIPWMVGMRVLFYRKDIYEQAGIDPLSAFQSHDAIDRTLETLKAKGVETPWAVPTVATINTMHYVANWIWSAGGDFISQDGKKIRFNSAASIAGLKKYYRLGRFLPQPATALYMDHIGNLFWNQGTVATIIGGHWQIPAFDSTASPTVMNNLGVAPLPGIAFLGGSNLVVWEHVKNKLAAIRLIRFLTSERVQKVYPQRVGFYPARNETLAKPPYTNDPVFREIAAHLESGRAYPAVSLWGIIERRLPRAFSDIWQDYLQNPEEADLDAILHKHLDPLAKRLSLTLQK
jgi:multiple sugar transport system substrate-binding protein